MTSHIRKAYLHARTDRIAVELEPRTGRHRPVDRLDVPRAVERAARQTLDNLEWRFAELSARVALR